MMNSWPLFRFVGEARANSLDRDTRMGIADEAFRLYANLAGGIVGYVVYGKDIFRSCIKRQVTTLRCKLPKGVRDDDG